MNIEEAIKRVSSLKANIERCQNISSKITRDVPKGRPVCTTFMDRSLVDLDRDDLIAFLRYQAEKNMAEIIRIQHVIDMANAALKGILQ